MDIVVATVEHFFMPLDQERQQPLTDSQTELLAKLILAPPDPERDPEIVAKAIAAGSFSVAVTNARCSLFTRPVKPRVVLFLASLAKSKGEIVMLLSYAMYKLLGTDDPLGLDQLCQEVFPMGTYSKEVLEKAWDAQKGFRYGLPNDNMLDSPEVIAYLNGKF